MKTRLLFILSTLFLLLTAKSSFAVDFNVGIDSPPVQLSGVVDFDRLFLTATDSVSYCCSMHNPNSATNSEFSNTLNFFDVNPAPVARGNQIPAISAGVANAVNRRYCWYEANGSPGSFFNASRGFVFSITGTINPLVSCEETTLYGNYNTSVTEFNFLELTARSSSTGSADTINGVITLISSINGQKRTQNFSINFETLQTTNTRIDISIHDLLLNQGDFGAVVIKHNGAPGQLSAKVSYYDITRASPLDFTLVGQADFRKGSK